MMAEDYRTLCSRIAPTPSPISIEAARLKTDLIELMPGLKLKLASHPSSELCGGNGKSWFWLTICGAWNYPSMAGKVIIWGGNDGVRGAESVVDADADLIIQQLRKILG